MPAFLRTQLLSYSPIYLTITKRLYYLNR